MDQPSAPIPPQPTATTPTTYVATPTPKKKNLLWLWITLGVLGLLAVVGIVLYLIMYPGIQARSTADGFMKAVKESDSVAIKKYTGSDPGSFYTTISNGLHGAAYSLSTSKKDSNGTYTFDYTITGSASLKNTVVTIEGNSVTKLLTNTRGGSTASTTTQTPTTTTTTKTDNNCLTTADFRGTDLSAYTAIYADISLQTVFFEPDSLEYSFPSIEPDDYSKAAATIKTLGNKDFSVHLQGSVYKDYNTEAGTSFAKQRSEKVKNDLVAAGVDASRITIVDPIQYEYGQDDTSPEIFRRVDVNISSPERCVTPY